MSGLLQPVIDHVREQVAPVAIVRARPTQPVLVVFRTQNSLYEFETDADDETRGTLRCRRGTHAGHTIRVSTQAFYMAYPCEGMGFFLPGEIRTSRVTHIHSYA